MDPAPLPAVMSSHRLLVCLAILGWSVRELARRLACHQTTVMRWTGATSPVPDEVAAWLEALTSFHAAHPAPRAYDNQTNKQSATRESRNRMCRLT